jgi:hypothetical protein
MAIIRSGGIISEMILGFSVISIDFHSMTRKHPWITSRPWRYWPDKVTNLELGRPNDLHGPLFLKIRTRFLDEGKLSEELIDPTWALHLAAFVNSLNHRQIPHFIRNHYPLCERNQIRAGHGVIYMDQRWSLQQGFSSVGISSIKATRRRVQIIVGCFLAVSFDWARERTPSLWKWFILQCHWLYCRSQNVVRS